MCVNRAISWERLHAYDNGLWGGHLWVVVKVKLEVLGRHAQEKFETQSVLALLSCDHFLLSRRMAAFPRWAGLNHFKEVLKLAFTDGTKNEHVLKVNLF